MQVVAEWKLLQQLPTLSLAQLNQNLARLLANKQGSLALYKQLAERCRQLCQTAEDTEVEQTLTLFTGVELNSKDTGDLYFAALPKVKTMIPNLPAERVAKLVVAYASSGLTDTPLYELCNSVLKPRIPELPLDLSVRLSNWLSPHLQPLPEAETIYPALETIQPLTPLQAVTLLQGFVSAKKGSVEFFRRTAETILTHKGDLDPLSLSAGIHFLCTAGLSDGRLTQRLEGLACEFEDISLLVAAAFDLAGVNYKPGKLLEAVKTRAAEISDVRDLVEMQWVYNSFGEEMPRQLDVLKAFLVVRKGGVREFLLGRRVRHSFRIGTEK